MTSIETIETPEGPRVSVRTSRYSVSKCTDKSCDSVGQGKKVDPKKLGGSGIASSRRSSITKSFLSKTQAGFDDVGDKSKGIQAMVQLSSSRPSNVASILSQYLGDDDDEENTKKFLCIPITNNVKALFTMTVLFASISIGQYFAAEAAHSQSLKADVVSMAMDAVSYLGNIIGEGSDVPAQRIVLQLFFSLFSLFLLNYFNTVILLDSISIMKTAHQEEEDGGDGTGVVATIVFTFALLGLIVDGLCLYAYRVFAQKDAEIEYAAMLEAAKLEGTDLEQTAAELKKPQINMLTALLHVSADLMRSCSTFVEGIVLFAGGLTPAGQEYVDAICGIFIGATIYAASIYAIYEWLATFYGWFTGLGNAIEVECPECHAAIEIQHAKAESGKVADIVLG